MRELSVLGAVSRFRHFVWRGGHPDAALRERRTGTPHPGRGTAHPPARRPRLQRAVPTRIQPRRPGVSPLTGCWVAAGIDDYEIREIRAIEAAVARQQAVRLVLSMGRDEKISGQAGPGPTAVPIAAPSGPCLFCRRLRQSAERDPRRAEEFAEPGRRFNPGDRLGPHYIAGDQRALISATTEGASETVANAGSLRRTSLSTLVSTAVITEGRLGLEVLR